eukprot:m.43710 g.43710  ORF g.43710 m.43710 type:complete len:182 (-) comp5790_c0_seq1:1572-2117(-)
MTEHPLHTGWTFWYDMPVDRKSQTDWDAALKNVGTFTTVEGFWRLYNHLCTASRLPKGGNYYFFRTGIRPAWEDEKNADGGRWQTAFAGNKGQLDQAWMNLILACIGEAFEGVEDNVCGVVFSPRKVCDKLSLWTRTCKEEPAKAIGAKMKEVVESESKYLFHPHKATGPRHLEDVALYVC